MNLIIYVNKHYKEEKVLFDQDKEEILLKGDYYQDKIDNTIYGYLKALRDFNIYEKDVEEQCINSEHQLYEFLNYFYTEDEKEY